MARSSKKKRSKLINSSPPVCYPTVAAAVIERLNKHDVLLGRGAMIISLEGNAHFRVNTPAQELAL
jgi:hypothetical protein